MAGPSLEDIQEEFADLDLPITDDEVLERLQVHIFLEDTGTLPIIDGYVIRPRLLLVTLLGLFIYLIFFLINESATIFLTSRYFQYGKWDIRKGSTVVPYVL